MSGKRIFTETANALDNGPKIELTVVEGGPVEQGMSPLKMEFYVRSLTADVVQTNERDLTLFESNRQPYLVQETPDEISARIIAASMNFEPSR